MPDLSSLDLGERLEEIFSDSFVGDVKSIALSAAKATDDHYNFKDTKGVVDFIWKTGYSVLSSATGSRTRHDDIDKFQAELLATETTAAVREVIAKFISYGDWTSSSANTYFLSEFIKSSYPPSEILSGDITSNISKNSMKVKVFFPYTKSEKSSTSSFDMLSEDDGVTNLSRGNSGEGFLQGLVIEEDDDSLVDRRSPRKEVAGEEDDGDVFLHSVDEDASKNRGVGLELHNRVQDILVEDGDAHEREIIQPLGPDTDRLKVGSGSPELRRRVRENTTELDDIDSVDNLPEKDDKPFTFHFHKGSGLINAALYPYPVGIGTIAFGRSGLYTPVGLTPYARLIPQANPIRDEQSIEDSNEQEGKGFGLMTYVASLANRMLESCIEDSEDEAEAKKKDVRNALSMSLD